MIVDANALHFPCIYIIYKLVRRSTFSSVVLRRRYYFYFLLFFIL